MFAAIIYCWLLLQASVTIIHDFVNAQSVIREACNASIGTKLPTSGQYAPFHLFLLFCVSLYLSIFVSVCLCFVVSFFKDLRLVCRLCQNP